MPFIVPQNHIKTNNIFVGCDDPGAPYKYVMNDI